MALFWGICFLCLQYQYFFSPSEALLLNESAYFTVRRRKWTELWLSDLQCGSFERKSCSDGLLLFCLLSVPRIDEVVVCSPVYQRRSLLCSGRNLPCMGWTVLTVGKVSTTSNALYGDRAEVASWHGSGVMSWASKEFWCRYNLKAVHFQCCHVRRLIDSHWSHCCLSAT